MSPTIVRAVSRRTPAVYARAASRSASAVPAPRPCQASTTTMVNIGSLAFARNLDIAGEADAFAARRLKGDERFVGRVVDVCQALQLRLGQVGHRRQKTAGARERAEVLELELHLGRVPGLDRADDDLCPIVQAHPLAGDSSARRRRCRIEVEPTRALPRGPSCEPVGCRAPGRRAVTRGARVRAAARSPTGSTASRRAPCSCNST